MSPDLALLKDLSEEINGLELMLQASATKTIELYIDQGKFLLMAKEAVPHGRWEQWVYENLSVSPRSAQKRMRIAKKTTAELEQKYETMTDCLESLAVPKSELEFVFEKEHPKRDSLSVLNNDVIEHEPPQQGPYAVVEGQTPEEATEEESIQIKQLQDNQDIREAKAQAAAQRKEINKNNPLSSFEIITAELRNLTESQKAIIAGNIIITVHSNELREIDRSMAERRKMESKKYRRVS